MRLSHLGDFEFIGDLSLQDADVLAKYAKKSKLILEFGVGAVSYTHLTLPTKRIV